MLNKQNSKLLSNIIIIKFKLIKHQAVSKKLQKLNGNNKKKNHCHLQHTEI